MSGKENKKLGWDYPKENDESKKSTSAQKYDKSLYQKYKFLKVNQLPKFWFLVRRNQIILGICNDCGFYGNFGCWNS